MAPQHIQYLLELAANSKNNHGVVTYPLGKTKHGQKILYRDLLQNAEEKSKLLIQIPGFRRDFIVLLHFNDHLDNILWFWAVIRAGGIPAMSTPFTNIPSQRHKHIAHLQILLNSPICITRAALLDQFSGQELMKPYAIESLPSSKISSGRNGLTNKVANGQHIPDKSSSVDDLALLMLTSGSTGNAKAVRLSHDQIVTCVKGKASIRQIPNDLSFLNWIGLDHVASMVEIHLQAIYLDVDQIHVQVPDIISNPALFLNLISKHRVSRSFAPNFFLAKLRQMLESKAANTLKDNLDLSCLRVLASGGEANPVATCQALTKLLSFYGAPSNVMVTGFGMTETCAGSIFNLDCPRYDVQNNNQFASLGRCMPGIEMRITSGSHNGTGLLAGPNESGLLEVRGPAVFKGYFNNTAATEAAFTLDGWYMTGDQAFIDSAGKLNLIGRTNDETIIINGVKHLPNELEAAIEESLIEGMTPNYTVCFPWRSAGADTEQIFIVYLPSYEPDNIEVRVATRDSIIQVAMLQTGSRPSVLPLNSILLQRSTLGKLSRFKIRASLEHGEFKECKDFDEAQIQEHNSRSIVQAANEHERVLQQEFCLDLGLSTAEFGVETPVFEMGVTSLHLIRLKTRLEKSLSILDIPILLMMTNPTVRSLSKALEDIGKPKEYDPVVPLQKNGSKTPIWLIHPGVGEVLVFLGLAKFITDRPVFALRARGFQKGETYFKDINEAVTTYHAAIKAKQPHGPYALAGYSYGTMLAFETSKLLESNGDKVAFLGSFNLPPHIKKRMEQLDWIECLLHLAYFLSLITAEHAEQAAPMLHKYTREQALKYVIELADPIRLAELSLSSEAIANWADLAYGLQSMAREYEPSGSVAVMDVFFCEPLKIVATTKDDWVKNSLSKWRDFCRSDVRFHEVMGEHYTMISEAHVVSFQKALRKALEARGL